MDGWFVDGWSLARQMSRLNKGVGLYGIILSVDLRMSKMDEIS